MPLFTLRHHFGSVADYTTGNYTETIVTSDYNEWTSPFITKPLPFNLSNNILRIRSVRTEFNKNNHGYYDGRMELSWLNNHNSIVTARDGGTTNTYGSSCVPMFWDGIARHPHAQLDMELGRIHHPSQLQFRLVALRSKGGTGTGTVIDTLAATKGATTYHPAATGRALLGPMMVEIVFEFDSGAVL